MMRQHFRLARHPIGKLLFKRSGNLRVDLLATASHQACVDCVLDQCVLEQILGFRWQAALKDELSSDELCESGSQILFYEAGYSSDQRIGELPADGGSRLHHVFHGGEPIKTREQRGVQR